MRKMMDGFTALRLVGMTGAQIGKEKLLHINEKLNRVRKNK